MENKFERFTIFGNISDKEKRSKIANDTYNKLVKNDFNPLALNSVETENFNCAIDQITSNNTLKELCENDSILSEKITQEILDFINDTKFEIQKAGNPIGEEFITCLNFKNTVISNFNESWSTVKECILKNSVFNHSEIQFYERELKKFISPGQAKEDDELKFDALKENLIEKWSAKLELKQASWELKIIDEQRKIFCEELYKRIEELKKLREALQPFTNELGRLWDMSQGRWKKASFDILKKYAELLKRDKSVQELAEMLGRMRQAEKEFEEELFASNQLKTEWKVEHASKADLIGIHESDDLSSLLPSEVALLGDSNLQSLFYKKFVEKKLQTFEYQAKVLSYSEEEFLDKRQKEKEEAKGPFIICVDTSGSMHGTPETVSKMLCFAILKLAIRENRKCYLISFSTGIQTINLTDLNNSLDKILEFLSMSFHGGTDASPAMNEALRMLGTDDYKKADVIVVSDFVMPSFGETTKKQIVVAKENKTKFHSLVIGSSQNKNVIQEFDNNWLYDSSKPDCVLTLVKSISQM
jgi:uncharacterized protein with von Willebrand factor type A (vWA) domain